MLWLCFSFYAAVVIAAAFLTLLLRDRGSTADTPPGSRGLPLIGETLQFLAAINSSNGVYDFVRIRCLRYGRCFKTRIFGETHVFVSSTDAAKLILNDGGGKFTKKYIRSIAELVGDRSLLCASHLHHKLLRGRLINLFSATFLASFVTQFDEQIVEALRSWESGSTIIVLNQALKITCKAMCKMLMSLESERELEVLQQEVAHVCEAMLAFPWRFPGTRFHSGLKARRRIIQILGKAIEERRRSEAWREDFLQRLMTKDEDGGGGTLLDAEIVDNILTMMIAGQDTTASAITWMVKFLDENHDVLHNLRDEQFQISNKRGYGSSKFLTLEDLGNMSYGAKVVKESLRLASVVPWFPRLVLEDSHVEVKSQAGDLSLHFNKITMERNLISLYGDTGYEIKRGWSVNIDVRSLHSDPSVYSDPTKFDPSRFDDEAKPYSFLAFGMGGRQCLGMNMAKAMMLVFLHRLVTSYRWKVIDSDSSIEKWALFSKLKSGCPIVVTRIEP